MKRATIITFSVCAIWAVLVSVHFVTRTVALLHDFHSGDLYAYSWTFQVVAFTLWPLPIWLLALCVILTIVYFFLKQQSQAVDPDETSRPNPNCK